MKLKLAAAALLLTCLPASAAFVTLTSPDGNWSFSSDEYGAFGEGAAGSFAQRNFGSGLTGYGWAGAVLLSSGGTNQWLAGSAQFTSGGYGGTALTTTVSDTTVLGVRTSVFTNGALPDLSITLVQSVTNSGIKQSYTISNTGAASAILGLTQFLDVDLDGGTFLNNTVTASGGYLGVSEGTRSVFFGTAGPDYAGFLSGHVAGGGITGSLNTIAQTSGGIPAAALNSFRDVSNAALGANFDADANGVSDTPSDVGFLLGHNLTIAAGGSVTVDILTGSSPVPEPSTSALFGLLGMLAFRRRR